MRAAQRSDDTSGTVAAIILGMGRVQVLCPQSLPSHYFFPGFPIFSRPRPSNDAAIPRG